MTRSRALAIPALVALCMMGLEPRAAPDLPPANFEIITLSNRADLVSGGDALVEVRVPRAVPLPPAPVSQP
jgi:hypothetical protein